MSEPRALVEHFFRHEFGRLVALLTRSLGMRRLDLVEDVVQAALVQALEIWSRRGVPEDPAGWLYRTARNLVIDALRRERTHPQASLSGTLMEEAHHSIILPIPSAWARA
jgi:predicted RNA polymerase sigma factor